MSVLEEGSVVRVVGTRSFGSVATKYSILVPKIPTVNSEFCKSLATSDLFVCLLSPIDSEESPSVANHACIFRLVFLARRLAEIVGLMEKERTGQR